MPMLRQFCGGMAQAIRQGLEMPIAERRERWRAMLSTLRRHDADARRRRFIDARSAAE